MPLDKSEELKKKLRETERDMIAARGLIDDTERQEAAISQSLSVGNYKGLLQTSSIPFISSDQYLTEKGFDLSQINVDDFLASEEINKIHSALNKPLVERLKWDRWDYIFAFAVSFLGVTIDTLVGNPKNGISKMCSDKDSYIGEWFEKIHSKHSSGSPMDYQGFKMGGGGHRLRSIGHDLLGFPYGVWQIMNGTFTGGYFEDGKFIEIISKVNQNGNPYESKEILDALFTYIGHIFCDFFSSASIPVPGFGYLAQMPSRDIRKFAADMYNGGYNLRHFAIQGFSVLFVEIMVRTYAYFRIKSIEGIDKAQYIQKRRELLLLSHAIVAGFNVGKVAITGDILSINIPQILAVGFHFVPFVMFHSRNNNETQKLIRNIGMLEQKQTKLESIISKSMIESNDFKSFLRTDPITLSL